MINRVILFSLVLLTLSGCDKFRQSAHVPPSTAEDTQNSSDSGEGPQSAIDRLAVFGPTLTESYHCDAYRIQTQDSTGPLNVLRPVTVNLLNTGAGNFYVDGSCVAAITKSVISPGTHEKTVYYSSNTAESLTLRFEAPPLTPAELEVTVLGQANLIFNAGNSHDFGCVQSGQQKTDYLQIENNGTGPLTGLSVSALFPPYEFAGGTYPGTLGNCTDELPAGSTCYLAITFSPVTQSVFNRSLVFSYHDGLSATSSTLSIRGRSLNSGELDLGFSTNGSRTFGIFSGTTAAFNDYAYAGQVQPDGKLLIAGSANNTSGSFFTVVRLEPDGELDTSFATTGKKIISFEGSSQGRALQLQSDGKILIGGYATISSKNQFALARVHSNGSLDNSFGASGLVTMSFARAATAFALAIDSSGRPVLAGSTTTPTGSQMAIGRYTTAGEPDATFAGSGQLTFSFASFATSIANAIAVDTAGKILLSGYVTSPSRSYFASLRLRSTGIIDTTYANSGRLVQSLQDDDRAYALAVLTDGAIIQAGSATHASQTDFALQRILNGGAADSSFGQSGEVIFDIDSATDTATTTAIDSLGRILIGGYGRSFALSRLLADGNLDTAFGQDGKITTSIGAGPDQANALALGSDGSIYLVGRSFNGTNYDFAIAKYVP